MLALAIQMFHILVQRLIFQEYSVFGSGTGSDRAARSRIRERDFFHQNMISAGVRPVPRLAQIDALAALSVPEAPASAVCDRNGQCVRASTASTASATHCAALMCRCMQGLGDRYRPNPSSLYPEPAHARLSLAACASIVFIGQSKSLKIVVSPDQPACIADPLRKLTVEGVACVGFLTAGAEPNVGDQCITRALSGIAVTETAAVRYKDICTPTFARHCVEERRLGRVEVAGVCFQSGELSSGLCTFLLKLDSDS